MMASLMRQAWSGRNARFNRVCEAAMRRSPSSRCRWLCALTPLRDGSSVKHSGRKPGIASAPSTSKVPITAAGSDSIQHRASASRLSGASSERRRLSSILKRPMMGNAWGPRRAPKIHGSSCQSPRVQRCWRLPDTS